MPFFWIALGVTALATVGIGLTISVLARTQREASMGALSYMLSVGLVLIICRLNDFRLPPTLMIEHHGPAMILAANGTLEITYTWKRTHIKHVTADPKKLRG